MKFQLEYTMNYDEDNNSLNNSLETVFEPEEIVLDEKTLAIAMTWLNDDGTATQSFINIVRQVYGNFCIEAIPMNEAEKQLCKLIGTVFFLLGNLDKSDFVVRFEWNHFSEEVIGWRSLNAPLVSSMGD